MPTPSELAVPESRPGVGVHHVKCHPQHFQRSLESSKNFEVRLNDRDYRLKDVLVIHEWDPELGRGRVAEGYTGRYMRGTIYTVLTSDDSPGLNPGYVVLGVGWFEQGPTTTTRGT